MPFSLLKYGLGFKRRPILRAADTLKSHYDVAIIGGGGHGLAAAYYLAKRHGITNVAVLEKGWLGGGNTARNTAIIRSNYLTDEGIRFYDQSVQLFKGLSNELGLNIMYSPRGHLTLAHTDGAIRTSRWRAEQNQKNGVTSYFVTPQEISELCPQLNLSESVRFPILGALYHPGGAIARHDAVAWGYARGAMERGVDIHTHTEVTGVEIERGKVTGLQTSKGKIRVGAVLQAVAGSSPSVSRLAGFDLPIRVVPLQACVSEPVKPVLDPIIVSGSLHAYISQSARGEFVMGGATDPYPLNSTRSSPSFKEELMTHLLELFPFLGRLRLLRQWGGMADLTEDFSPIMGETPIQNYYVDAGWGTWGFKATPISGLMMSEMLATGKTPDLIKSFSLTRFESLSLVGERAAASVGH